MRRIVYVEGELCSYPDRPAFLSPRYTVKLHSSPVHNTNNALLELMNRVDFQSRFSGRHRLYASCG